MCGLFGVFLTFLHLRWALFDARLREKERCAAEKRKQKVATKSESPGQ